VLLIIGSASQIQAMAIITAGIIEPFQVQAITGPPICTSVSRRNLLRVVKHEDGSRNAR
jgi:hypothetical protein